MKLYIKNMACESCKVLVKDELEKIHIKPLKVELGEVEVKNKISEQKLKNFASGIKKGGLEITKNKEGILIDKMKQVIQDFIKNKKSIRSNLSDYMSKKLNYDYTYLSGYFSSMQASTIEQYYIGLKIEKAKELLVLSDMTLSEIADKLDYSSVSHLSHQFKQVTGLSASHFKKLKIIRRKTMQEL